MEEVERLLEALNPRGNRESGLREALLQERERLQLLLDASAASMLTCPGTANHLPRYSQSPAQVQPITCPGTANHLPRYSQSQPCGSQDCSRGMLHANVLHANVLHATMFRGRWAGASC